MNKKISLFLVLFSLNLFAYSDYDMDGVSNENDKCPNTPFSDLVDKNGCTKKTLKSPHKFSLSLGYAYSVEGSDTLTTTKSLQLGYRYRDFSLQASSSYYTTDTLTYDDSGVNDSYVGFYYKFHLTHALSATLGEGFIIPTYDSSLDNNNLDYKSSLSLHYTLNKFALFGSYSYTFINDDDTQIVYDDGSSIDVLYQNKAAYSLGFGFYPNTKTYVSIAYNSIQSVYLGGEDLNSLSVNLFYNVSKHFFYTLTFAGGLSDSADDGYNAIRVGYYF